MTGLTGKLTQADLTIFIAQPQSEDWAAVRGIFLFAVYRWELPGEEAVDVSLTLQQYPKPH